MKITKTFNAVIWVGFKERNTGILHTIEEAEKICQDYCDAVGLCVSITPTKFVYTHGGESGCAIGLINYPRFPSTEKTIMNHAISLGNKLLEQLGQYKVSIVCNKKTIMLENDNV